MPLNLLGLFLRNWQLFAVGGLLAFGLSYVAWANHEHHAAQAARAEIKTERREAVAQNITAKVSAKTETARVEIRWRTRTLIEKVPTYVTPAADAVCIIPRGFVRLHDAAAAGVPEPAGGPDEAPSGVQLSAVAETVVGNYGVAYEWRQEALAWREWYAEQKKAWEHR